jgi:hypothetical protein
VRKAQHSSPMSKKKVKQSASNLAPVDNIGDGVEVQIEPELFAVFPSAEAVNTALRLLVKASRKAVNSKAARQARAKLVS